MTASELVIYLLIAINLLVLIWQQKNLDVTGKIAIRPERVLKHKEYYRIISSAFGHTGWLHFGINMYVLYSFSLNHPPNRLPFLSEIGIVKFLIIYFSSAIGSSLYILLMRKDDRSYSAIGASGAISGLIYAFAYINEDSRIGLMLIPVFVDGWLFVLIFTWGSLLLTQLPKAQGFISHEGHIGGGLFGAITAILLFPELLNRYPLYYFILGIGPIFAFILIKLIKPDLLYKYLR